VSNRQRMNLRVQLSYELDPYCGSDAVEILIALRKALPRIGGQALLRSFVAYVAHGGSHTGGDHEGKSCSLTRTRRKPNE